MKLAAVLLGFALVAAAGAQKFPGRPDGTFVVDTAGIISSADKAEITRMSQNALQSTGAPIVVATVPSLASVDAQSIGIEAYAHRMFDAWRIGSQHANHGILLVVAKDDHKARIELGQDWDHRYDPDSHRIMTGTIIPQFKRGDYSSGIRDGARDLLAMLHSAAAETPAQTTQGSGVNFVDPDGFSDQSPGVFEKSGLFPLVFLGIFAFVFIAVIATIVDRIRGVASPLSWTRRRRYGSPYDSATNVWVDPNADYDYSSSSSDIGIASTFDSSSSGSTFDSSSSSSSDYGSSDSGGGFDSGSSGGGGDSGSW